MDPRLLKDEGWKLLKASKTEKNPRLAQAMRDCAQILFGYYGQTFLPAATEINMRDLNIAKDSQVGAIGSEAKAENNTMVQANANSADGLDLMKLVVELATLSSKLVEGSQTPQTLASAGSVAKARCDW
jgi:hypothetical protein